MVRAGLPMPVADGSRVGWIEPVLSDVGDDQSIARSLSTFSAHVTNLAQILDQMGPGALWCCSTNSRAAPIPRRARHSRRPYSIAGVARCGRRGHDALRTAQDAGGA